MSYNAQTPQSRTSRKARAATLAAVGMAYPVMALGIALCGVTLLSGSAHAAEAPAAAVQMTKADQAPAIFQKKTYALDGSVTVEQRGDQTVLVFSDDFKTRKGPDLKVFLSKNTVASANGDNATTDAIRLGALISNKGTQEYVLPQGVNLADYSSVLVQCEAFSKLWGGADLA